MDDYQDLGLKPRAIVLWETDVEVPAGAARDNIFGRQRLQHDKMVEALAAFFADWMKNRPLNICMNAFVHKALDGTILGIDRFDGMENYKKYFLGKRYKSAGYRLAVALLLFLYGVIIASQRSIHPYLTPRQTFWMSVEMAFFEFIMLFLLPVLIWGKHWERILACSLSFILLVNLFVYLMAIIGD